MIAFTLSPLIVAAILAASLAVVVLLYLLRPPARRRHVSSNLIWQRVLDAYRRVSDRWRWWLSLLIASLVCASIVLAVVRPGSEAGAAGKGKVVLVIDNAPTMATISSSGKERFEIAKERAVTLIKDFSPATQVMVVDTQRRLTTPEFVSPRQAVETVQSLQLGQSFRPIVPSAIASIPAERRYVVTDGVLLGAPPPDYVTVSVFEAAENLGITAFDFDNVPGNPAQREAFVEVFNAGNQPVSAEVVISGLGKERISRKVSVPAHGYTGQTFDVSAFPGGPIRAALTATGDAYRADDVAYGYLSSRRSVHVVLVTNSGGNYLSKSLSAQPRVHLKVESPRRYMDQVAAGSSQADIYVFDRVVPKQPPPGPALLIGARPASWLPPSAGEVKYPEIAAANLRHPVLRDISLRDLYIERGDYLKAPQDDTTSVLLRTDDDRVLAIAHDGLPRWVLVGFDVANSNFGLLPAFPVFLGNTINWLADEPEILRAQPGMIPVPFQQARVVAMDGSELPVVNVDKRSFFDATQPGLYTAIGKDRPIRIAVNLLERRISDVNRTAVATATTETAAADGKSDWPLGLSALLLILAAALLCVEWVAYHRRVTV
jgi:hypothetical protein